MAELNASIRPKPDFQWKTEIEAPSALVSVSAETETNFFNRKRFSENSDKNLPNIFWYKNCIKEYIGCQLLSVNLI